ncbi:hypothetical protein VTK73DRAFT_248 [Phialemonium thermophilum]|uniref:Uncharacterized protein n=1 Tax=Phialemonium thermophilum TaxID=223376 RepID=A0ABR3VW46_9PEZI
MVAEHGVVLAGGGAGGLVDGRGLRGPRVRMIRMMRMTTMMIQVQRFQRPAAAAAAAAQHLQADGGRVRRGQVGGAGQGLGHQLGSASRRTPQLIRHGRLQTEGLSPMRSEGVVSMWGRRSERGGGSSGARLRIPRRVGIGTGGGGGILGRVGEGGGGEVVDAGFALDVARVVDALGTGSLQRTRGLGLEASPKWRVRDHRSRSPHGTVRTYLSRNKIVKGPKVRSGDVAHVQGEPSQFGRRRSRGEGVFFGIQRPQRPRFSDEERWIRAFGRGGRRHGLGLDALGHFEVQPATTDRAVLVIPADRDLLTGSADLGRLL